VPIDDAVLTAALAETGADHGPGLFGLVTDHGEVVFEGSGVADLIRPRPIAEQSTCVFHSPHSWRGEDAAARCARWRGPPTGMVMVGRLAVDPYQLR
jgi:hypothetical protein